MKNQIMEATSDPEIHWILPKYSIQSNNILSQIVTWQL